MKSHGKITVARYAEDNWNPEITEIFAGYFESKSIQSAKTYLTKMTNETELFAWVQSWDNEKRIYTGKELRWRPWSAIVTYKQDNGIEVAYSTRMCEREFGETLDTGSIAAQRFGKSVEYRVDLALHWKFKGK